MKKIIIVDGSAWMYRAFFGKPEDPVSGLNFLIDQAITLHEPDEAVVAFDYGRETFRNQIYPGYKSTRRETPPDYTTLQPILKGCFADRGLKPLSVKGYEADDIIGTLCAKLDTYLVVILSRDKDLMQLVCDHVSMCNDGVFVHEAEVIEKFGVGPELVTNVLGLQGDSTDNIPGVAGIGAKTASKLIAEFGPLEVLFECLNLPSGRSLTERVRMLLKTGKESAFLSRELATIKTDVPLEDF